MHATVRTKSIYQPDCDADGIRVLVTRFYPRGVKKEHFHTWARDLAPSAKLLADYKKQKLTWQKFSDLFKQELLDRSESLQLIKDLRLATLQSKPVTLLCYEPEGVPYHRHLLREIIYDDKLLLVSFKPEYTDN